MLWFAGFLVAGLCWFHGGVGALADRLTMRREPGPSSTAGPSFAAAPAVVARAGDDADDEPPPPPPAATGDRGRIGALEDVCLEGAPPACRRWGMDAFYRALADARRGVLGHALRVSWYGDSVVATDAIPGRLRARLQGELGDGGPGFVFVVPPHRFCHHGGVVRATGGEWQPHAVSTNPTPDGLYGPGGSTAETEDGRATIKLTAGTARELELYYLAQPRGGTAVVTADRTEVLRVATRADAKQPGFAAASLPEGATSFRIEADGRLRLFGLGLENPRGAVVDNLGIVSVNVKNFASRDAEHFAATLAHRRPDLVLVMIGANEAQWLHPGDHDTKHYQENYEKAIAPVRRARPDAACLVVSPLDQAEPDGTGYRSRAVMPVLVDAQRRAAHARGCAFYSTYDWMGGKGSAEKWFRRGYVGSDFQHLSKKGADRMADGVYDALMAGAQRHAGG